MEPELVKKTGVDVEDGYIYFVADDGHIYRIKEVGYPGKKIKIEKIKSVGIEKANGYAYFLDKSGDIRRVFLDKIDIKENLSKKPAVKKKK